MTRLRFSANLSLLWTDRDPLDRFRAASEAGFDFVEIQYPQALDARRIREALIREDLELVLFNLSPGSDAHGERGLLCLPRREDEFNETVAEGLRLARQLGVRRLNVPAGITPDDGDREALHAVAVANLRRASPAAAVAGITLLVEPLNPVDRPGYYLPTLADAATLLRAVDRRNVRLQFDVYHAGVTGDALASFRHYRRLIHHVQVADHPGRHEPGTGDLPIGQILQELEDGRYGGFVGLEYIPSGAVADSFAWMETFRGARMGRAPVTQV